MLEGAEGTEMPMPLGLVRQAGVIAHRADQVCLVTSRGGKRWVIPKGNIEAYKTAAEVALQEAWEEAGLVGLLRPDPVGTYFYEKDGQLCHVLVFLMRVTDEVEAYREAALRQRAWLSPEQARERIDDAGLKPLFEALSAVK